MKIIQKIIHSRLVFHSGIASIDQGMLSALNFLVSILLIKAAPKIEYGYYSIAFAVSLFFISLQNAIVNTPLTVLLPAKKGDDRRRYVGSLARGQFIFIIPLIGFMLMVIFFLWIWGIDSIQAGIAAALCLAAIGLLYREFWRTYFFAEEKSLKVLKLDALYAVFFLGMVGLGYWYFNLGVASIFLMMGMASFLASMMFNRKSGWKHDQLSIRESYRENWIYGRWSLLGVIVTHIQTYSYVYLLGLFLGSEAVADVSAARILMMPLVLFESGWGKIVRPHGSKLREDNKIQLFFKKQILMCLIFTIGAFIYVLLLVLSSDVFEKFLLSSKYANSFNYIYYWGLIFLLGFVSNNASFGLQVIKNFRIISLVNFITMLITVGYTYFLIQSNGIQGALIALIIGRGISALMLWFYFTKNTFFTVKNGAGSNLKVS